MNSQLWFKRDRCKSYLAVGADRFRKIGGLFASALYYLINRAIVSVKNGLSQRKEKQIMVITLLV